jgi:hypothetical protein
MSKQYPGGIISKTPVTPSGPYATSTASGIWTLDQQAYWQKLGQWPTAGNFPIDPQFNYVTMLLHGDGTNGAQNNTFLDSSSNNFTITRNGNTTQGSFSPYGSNWSNYFGGSDYLSLADNANLNPSTQDFVMEAWVYLTGTTGNNQGINGKGTAGTDGYTFFVTNALVLSFVWNGTGGATITGGTLGLNTWNHVAVVRNSSVIRLYLNGVGAGSSTACTTDITSTATKFVGQARGGNPILGYISNYRMTKGSLPSGYNATSSTLTVPTAPLTAISGTSLLTCQSNTFKDASANNFAITVNGTPSVQRFNPFGTSTAYSTSVIGGSGYFDGTGDYLSTASDANLAIGSSDFCIEFWVYSNNSNEITPFGQWVSPSGNQNWILQYRTGANQFRFYYNSSNELSGNYTIVPNAWTHVVVCRSGSTMSLYANGTRLATKTDSTSINNTTGLSVGRNADNLQYVTGFITDARIVVGSSVYTPSSSTLTVPTAPLTAITNTKFLANMTNGAIFDNAMMNDLETVGNAQISTSVVKYGTGSLAFDGTGDRLDGPATVNMAFGTGDYTIEFWCYPSNTGYGCFIDTRSANPSTNGVSIFNNGTTLEIYASGLILSASGAFTLNTWQFFALTRSGTSLKAFVNGTQVGSTVTNSDNQTAGRVKIGDNVENLYPLNGYIDDLRITTGYARYTTNFTPPGSAFPNIGPT